jgi:HTH-type transcriptional regulator / antitoxin HipB
MDYPIVTAQQLAAHLRALRKTRNLTQAELAQRLGLTQSRLGKIERHPESVSLEQLIKTLNLLGARLVISVPDRNTRVAAAQEAVW